MIATNNDWRAAAFRCPVSSQRAASKAVKMCINAQRGERRQARRGGCALPICTANARREDVHDSMVGTTLAAFIPRFQKLWLQMQIGAVTASNSFVRVTAATYKEGRVMGDL